MQTKRVVFLINIAAAFLIALTVHTSSKNDFFQRIELIGQDILFHLKAPPKENPNINIIEITDEDISKIGIWPWERAWHAALIEALNYMGAKAIYFDILFAESYSEEDDKLFGEAIKRAGNIYLPYAFQGISLDRKDSILPIPEIYPFAKGVGVINVIPSSDHNIREIPLFFSNKAGDIDYSMVLKIPLDYLGGKIKKIDPEYILLANDQREVKIPVIGGNTMLLNWSGKWEDTFRHYSFLDVLSAYQMEKENGTSQIDKASFKDSICLVAVTAAGICDIKSIPLQSIYPGVGVVATAISNILNGDFVSLMPPWLKILLIYLLALIAPVLVGEDKRNIREILHLIVLCGMIVIPYYFYKRGMIVNLVLPAVSFLTSYLVSITITFFYLSVEKAYFFKLANTDGLTGLLNIRYFRMLEKSVYLMVKAKKISSFSIIMGDIDNFKKVNDTYGHHVGDLALKETAKALKETIGNKGIVARYGGEELIVLLKNIPLKETLLIAEEARKRVEASIIKDGDVERRVTISLGVSEFKSEDETEDDIIKRADVALYEAKMGGKNCVKSEM